MGETQTMSNEAILRLLIETQDYVSGERICETLGVSRAAVWKRISALREQGYEIEAKANRGYRLLSSPDTPRAEAVLPLLQSKDFCRQIIYLDEIDSSNSHLKQLAAVGAPHGTVVIANAQTGGRGRMGRPFVSEAGKGLFLSLLLRPDGESLRNVTTLTSLTAVCVCEAIQSLTGIEPSIKWVNDILVDDRKICGILLEMSMVAELGQVDYVVVGVGINVHYQAKDFPIELRERVTSLAMLIENPVSRAKLAAELIDRLGQMSASLADPTEYVARYRARSATVGREILVLRGDESRPAFAESIGDDFGLHIRYPNGEREVLYYGETSIRGMHGYV